MFVSTTVDLITKLFRCRMQLAALLALVVMVTPAYADRLDKEASFAIPAQPLSTALVQFSKQAQLQLVTASVELGARETVGVSGRLTLREALDRLLDSTGLSYSLVGQNTVAISQVQPVAQVAPIELALANAQTKDAQPATASNATESEIIVTGSHIRGMKELAAPTIQITREAIENGGYSTLEEVLEDLPQNFGEVTTDGSFGIDGASRLARQNSEKINAADLRGLGPGSTLTLLNGSRRAGNLSGRAVDISAIPLSVIERVEIVTGGRSAVYGSDAVAGVVNFITRREFTGVETQAQYGWAQDGAEKMQLSAITGLDADRGGLVAAYDYGREWKLNLLDTGFAVPSPPLYAGTQTALELDIQPETWRHSGLLSGHFSLTERIELYADALYSQKKYQEVGRYARLNVSEETRGFTDNENSHRSLNAGLRFDLTRDWSTDLKVGFSEVDVDYAIDTYSPRAGGLIVADLTQRDSETQLKTASLVAEGPLFSLGDATARAAIGIESRKEEFISAGSSQGRIGANTYFNTNQDGGRRSVDSLFAELFVPLLGSASGTQSLDLTLAGRYDDYSDFGDTTNPQAGLVWSLAERFKIRGAYSRAFRAPDLVELGSTAFGSIDSRNDPVLGGVSPVLILSGDNANLGSERANTWSLGFDYLPTTRTRISLSYFDIEYKDRIDVPAFSTESALILGRADRFPDLLRRNPSASDVAALVALVSSGVVNNTTGRAWNPATQTILQAFPDLVLFDNRIANIAVEIVRGVDLVAASSFDLAVGKLDLQLNGTYTMDHKRRVTNTSPDFSLLNEVAKPVDFRLHANAGWSKGAFGALLALNYVDSYVNPFSVPAGASMDSWLTADLTLRLDGSELNNPLLDKVRATISVQNLFAQDPPRFANPAGFSFMGYDTANANVIGRYFSLRVAKQW